MDDNIDLELDFNYGGGNTNWKERRQIFLRLKDRSATTEDICQAILWLEYLLIDLGEKVVGNMPHYDDNPEISALTIETALRRILHEKGMKGALNELAGPEPEENST